MVDDTQAVTGYTTNFIGTGVKRTASEVIETNEHYKVVAITVVEDIVDFVRKSCFWGFADVATSTS